MLPEIDRQGLQSRFRNRFEEGQGQPGEIGAGRQEEQADRPGGDDGPDPLARAVIQIVEDPGQRRAAIPVRKRGRRGAVVVDPGTFCEIGKRHFPPVERMIPVGDDAPGDLQGGFPFEERRQGLPGIDAAAMKVGIALFQPPDALAHTRRPQFQLDPGAGLAEICDDAGQHRLHPYRAGGDSQAARTARDRIVDLVLGDLHFLENPTREVRGHGPQLGEAHAGRDAFEELSAELILQPCDHPGQRRLGDRQPVGGGEDLPGFGDRKKLDQIAPPFEHGAALRFQATHGVSRYSRFEGT